MQRQTSCLASSPEFLWIGFRGCDARAFEGLLNMAGLICCDWNEQLQELAHSVPVLSLERDGTERRSWRVSSVAEHDLEALRGLLGSRRADSGGAPRPVVIPYQMDPSVEAVIKAALPDGPRVLAPDVETVARIQDKRRQRKLFREAGIPTPESTTVLAGELARGEVPSSPALPAVVQPPVGSRGVDVHAVRTAEGIRTCRGPLVARNRTPCLEMDRGSVDQRGSRHLPGSRLRGLALGPNPRSFRMLRRRLALRLLRQRLCRDGGPSNYGAPTTHGARPACRDGPARRGLARSVRNRCHPRRRRLVRIRNQHTLSGLHGHAIPIGARGRNTAPSGGSSGGVAARSVSSRGVASNDSRPPTARGTGPPEPVRFGPPDCRRSGQAGGHPGRIHLGGRSR